MDDDFNTAEALAALFDAVSEGNRSVDAGEDAGPFAAAFDVIVEVLGLEPEERSVVDLSGAIDELAAGLGVEVSEDPAATIEGILAFRQRSRGAGDFEAADAAREGLAGLGISIEDTPDGTRWHRR